MCKMGKAFRKSCVVTEKFGRMLVQIHDGSNNL